ncbi:hypothetical protein GOP47_0027987, partial [Adiantum capillus-veneris]
VNVKFGTKLLVTLRLLQRLCTVHAVWCSLHLSSAASLPWRLPSLLLGTSAPTCKLPMKATLLCPLPYLSKNRAQSPLSWLLPLPSTWKPLCSISVVAAPIFADVADMLMVDPYLDFLNEVLMEEGMKDSPLLSMAQEDADAYYQATLSSLYDIISDHSRPGSTTSQDASAAHLSHGYVASHDPPSYENFSGLDLSHSWDKGSQFEQQHDATTPYVGLGENKNLGFFSSLLPTSGNPHMVMDEQESKDNSLAASADLSIRVEQQNRETSFSPARGNPHFSVEQVDSESQFSSGRGKTHVSLDQDKPETLPRLRENSLSQVETGVQYQHVEKSHASEHAVLLGFSDSRLNGREAQDQNQGTSNSSVDSESTSNLASIDVQIEDLKDEAGYAALYVVKPTATGTLKGSSPDGDMEPSIMARKGRKSVRNSNTEVLRFVDISDVLVSCAQAVAIGDGKRANEILQELYQVHGVSSNGNSLQRTAHCFCEALMARMGGMGGQLYRVMWANMPPPSAHLRIKRWRIKAAHT